MSQPPEKEPHAPGAIMLSVVLPAYNEQDNIRPMHKELRRVLDPLEVGLEIIFVDDGSRDATAARVVELSQEDPAVRLVRFTRNFGHQMALVAGLECARGDVAVTMDCDLQHPPEAIVAMLSKWAEGFMVVRMIREDNQATGWLKKTTSSLFYRLFNKLSPIPVEPGAADFQLLDRKVVEAVKATRDHRPFLRGLIGWLGFSTAALHYQAGKRASGRPGYNLGIMLRLAIDGITAFSLRPLRISLVLGMLLIFLFALYFLFVIIDYLTGGTVAGWPSTMIVILGLGSVQLIILGIMGEYLGRVYEQTRGRPRYIVYPSDDIPVSGKGDSGGSRGQG